MRHLLFSALFLCLFLPRTALTQTWTAEEQEIIDITRESWHQYLDNKDWDASTEALGMSPDALYWFLPQPIPVGTERNLHAYSKKSSEAIWMEFFNYKYWEVRPVAIRIYGEVATFYYWIQASYLDHNNQLGSWSQKRLYVYQRGDDRWNLIGGMSVPEEE